ncbi:MAG: hypothetical protein WCR13_00875 [Sphaerochaeta sp.]
MAIDDLQTDYFETRLQQLLPVHDDHYISVYESLLNISSTLKDQKSFDGLVSVAHMAYGWMPTVLHFNMTEKDTSEFFEKGEQGCLDQDFLASCKLWINHSIIGASKVLHFFYPNKYPIWDSKVYETIFGLKPHHYQVNSTAKYIQYTKKLRDLSQNSSSLAVLKEGLMAKGYCQTQASNLGVLELILFYSVR